MRQPGKLFGMTLHGIEPKSTVLVAEPRITTRLTRDKYFYQLLGTLTFSIFMRTLSNFYHWPLKPDSKTSSVNSHLLYAIAWSTSR